MLEWAAGIFILITSPQWIPLVLLIVIGTLFLVGKLLNTGEDLVLDHIERGDSITGAIFEGIWRGLIEVWPHTLIVLIFCAVVWYLL